jgi:hypothetical protein
MVFSMLHPSVTLTDATSNLSGPALCAANAPIAESAMAADRQMFILVI